MAIARYTLAVDRKGRRQDGDQGRTADFINIVAFERAGEFAEKYLRQGMRVLVTGRIQTGSYVNKDGQKVYTTDVVVEEQEFADSKGQGNGGSGSSYNAGSSRGSYQQGTRPAPSAAIGDGFMNIPDGVEDEGLPFN